MYSPSFLVHLSARLSYLSSSIVRISKILGYFCLSSVQYPLYLQKATKEIGDGICIHLLSSFFHKPH